jgi:hypothetical protein
LACGLRAFRPVDIDNIVICIYALNTILLGGNKNMRFAPLIPICLLSFISFIGTPMAAELTGAEIKDMISGKTVYLETSAAGSVTGASGQGVIYYAPDGTGLYKTPKGVMWHGTWEIKGNANCSTWKEAGNVACSKYDKQGDTVSIVNAETGQVRAKVLKTASGNAEKLAP